MKYRVDYFDTDEKLRTKDVDVKDEVHIPFAIRKEDKRFDRIHRTMPLSGDSVQK